MTSAVRRRIWSALSGFLHDPDAWLASVAGTGAVHRLEERFASLIGQPHAVAVANATLGIWVALQSLDVHDAEVITTPYTWGGSLAGIVHSGNRPVFADVDSQTLTLDPRSVLERITPRTKAILLVDIYGHPCNGPAFRNLADAHGLRLVQDCAQSFGAWLQEHHTGFWADASVFSFTWGKALFAGEGGMIVTPHHELFERVVQETQHPMRQRRDIPHSAPSELALNMRINPLAAVCALSAFDDALAVVDRRRRRAVRILRRLYDDRASRTPPPDLASIKPSFHALTFQPGGDDDAVHTALSRHRPTYAVSAPPIGSPLYCHEAYRRVAASRRWPAPQRCPLTETQCRVRLRLERTLELAVPSARQKSVGVSENRRAQRLDC